VVPGGGVPVTVPVVEPIDKNAGAPASSAKVGAGVPEAAKVYEYDEPTVAVVGGESAVNTGAAPVVDATTAKTVPLNWDSDGLDDALAVKVRHGGGPTVETGGGVTACQAPVPDAATGFHH